MSPRPAVAGYLESVPEYIGNGKLRTIRHTEDLFIHPHDFIMDEDGYLAQFASGETYPIKVGARVKRSTRRICGLLILGAAEVWASAQTAVHTRDEPLPTITRT